MAILKNGVYSTISGSLGSFVYYTLNGKTVVRTKRDPDAPKIPGTIAQIANRERFRLLSRLLSALSPVLSVGFSALRKGKTARGTAFRLNYNQSLIGIFPEFKIDYEQLQLSKGNAYGLNNLKMEDKGGGLFELTWNCAGYKCDKDEMVALVLYDEKRDSLRYSLDLASVGRQQAEFNIDLERTGKLHIYVFTIGKNKGGNSNSQYLGWV